MTHLDRLEADSIYFLREAFSQVDPLAMLWSCGKDSNVIVWLAKKVFFGHIRPRNQGNRPDPPPLQTLKGVDQTVLHKTRAR